MRPAYVRQLAAELELMSHGSCASWNPAGGGGIPDSRAPTGDANPPHLQFLAAWDRDGDAVLGRWHDVLVQWRGRGKARPIGKSEDELILEDGKSHAPEVVAQKFRCTPTRVRRLRTSRGLDAETGTRDLRSTVKALRAQKVSYRRIGAQIGRSKSQVQRMDRAA